MCILGKLRCLLGLHKWVYDLEEFKKEFGHTPISINDNIICNKFICERCGKKYSDE